MDGLDIRILRAMGVTPYGPEPRGPDAVKPGRLAKALGVTPETIRERLARMESSGLIAGYDVFPNLRHLGLEACGLLFDVKDEARRARIAEGVTAIEGIVDVFYFMGDAVCVDLCYRSDPDLERKRRLLSALMGDDEPASFYTWTLPPATRALSNLDWRIVRALRGNARRPLLEVAAEIGVSYRTVKRHHDAMANDGSIFIVPLLDFGAVDGLIPFGMLVHLAPGAPTTARRDVLAEVDDAYVFSQVHVAGRGNFDMFVLARSPKEAEALRARAAAVPGVERVDALVPREVTHHTEWIDELIEERIRATAVATIR